jgi:hypothetical protein
MTTDQPDDKPLKSSLELAMERLKKKDADAGVESRPASRTIRRRRSPRRAASGAKMAEAEVLHQSKMRSTADPGQRETLELQYRRDRERLTSDRDAKIEKIRNS